MDWWKKKKKKVIDIEHTLSLYGKRGAMLVEDIVECCDGKSNPIKFFSADLILKATNNFSSSNRVSGIQYSYWDWYSGMNYNYHAILIKQFANNTGKYDSYFCRDVSISSMVSGHKNFMKLVGCCLEIEHPLMVYYGEKNQYSCMDFEKIVSLERRMKIAEDIATALAYLHTAFSTPFVYRNMSIENILIDEDGVAKMSDFSCCISIPPGETFVTVNEVVGMYAYLDDNYIRNGVVSEITDVYGFGRFMLMLLMGEKGEYREPNSVSKFIEEGKLVDEIADPNMLENMVEVTEEKRCRMNAFVLLSVRCFGCTGEVPTMVEVAKELNKIQKSSQNAYFSSSS